MSIRRRVWASKTGVKEAWVVDYRDQDGKRRLRTFELKRYAAAFAANTTVQISEGTHVADSASITLKEAGDLWLDRARADGLEQATVEQYEQHLRLHIVPFLGRIKLSRLTMPHISKFRDQLAKGDPDLAVGDRRKEPRSSAMVRGIVGSLGAVIADAQERGLVARNVVREMRRRRSRGANPQDRRQGKLKVGIDIPTPEEVKALLSNSDGRWRPLFLVAVFAGLRASELRGLRWDDVDLSKGEVHVRQRADRYNVIGPPKSRSGERTIPLPPTVVSELRTWKLECPKRKSGHGQPNKLVLVFPNGQGNIESGANILKRGLAPTLLAAGLSRPVLDDKGSPKRDVGGKPIVLPKYSGLHMLRHFFASWCINRKLDGGLELPAKVVQERLGHASIVMTLDRYGHLFPRGDDKAELAEAERALLAR